MLAAKSARIVPGVAFEGLVAPMISRLRAMAFFSSKHHEEDGFVRRPSFRKFSKPPLKRRRFVQKEKYYAGIMIVIPQKTRAQTGKATVDAAQAARHAVVENGPAFA